MFQNNNKAVISHISKANLKGNIIRNRLAGVVIALASFLLTLASTFSYNAVIEMRNRTHYQALFENADMQVIEKIKKNKDVEAYGIHRQAGMVKSNNISLSLLYADEKTMELSNARLKAGVMPEDDTEIALEKGYLDSISSAAQIGDRITLDYRNDVSRQMQTKTFTITGFLKNGAEGETERKAFNAIVAKSFLTSDPSLSLAGLSLVIQVADADQYSNTELKAKIKEIGKAAGLPERSIHINYMNIDSNNTKTETSAVVFAIGFVVVTACTLVIYNIFYIQILRKINEYGQLRMLGTTRKQIKKIIFREGKLLSVQYIPLGLLAGCLLSYMLRPSMWNTIAGLIFAFSAGFITFLTVMLSLRKPAKIAAGVSPMEALRYRGQNPGVKKKKHLVKRLTPYSLGGMYLTRNKKKTAVTFLSLTLSGVLLIAAASLAASVDPVKRAGQEFPYDGEYIIQLYRDLLSPSINYNDLQVDNPLSKELIAEISAIDGVDGIEVHKYIRSKLEGVTIDDGMSGINNIREKDNSFLKKHLVEGALPSEQAQEKQILVNRSTITYKYYELNYRIGDQIPMILYDGKKQIEQVFTVSGVIEDKNSGDTFFLPDQVMDQLVTMNCNLGFEILAKQGYSSEVEAQLKALTASEEKLEYISRKAQNDLYKSAFCTIMIAVYAFVAMIACFGLVNLANTILMNILSRKNELGVLQAVGLTREQMIKMLNTENSYLIFGSFIVSVVLGGAFGYLLCRMAERTGGLSAFIQYQFPMKMILVYIILITIIQAVTTSIQGHSLQKQSVVERLREA